MNRECPPCHAEDRTQVALTRRVSERWSADYSSLNLLRARLTAGRGRSPSFSLVLSRRGCCPEMRYVCSLKMGAIVFDYWSLPLSNEYYLLKRPRNASPISPPLLNYRITSSVPSLQH